MLNRCTVLRPLAAALVAVGLLQPAGVSIAAAPPDAAAKETLEEIIVTARRRLEPLMAVPVTLTAINGGLLDDLQFRDIDDIVSLSPGVMTYLGGDSVSTRVSIRGVVSPGKWVEPGNAIYVDGIYSSGMLGAPPRFYDLASVEVLKAPQAGLYGRNTMGGAVLINTNQPVGEQQARLNASYAQYNEREIDGMVNVPLSEQVRLRAVGWYNDKNGGYYTSGVDDKNLDTVNAHGGRLTLAVLPNEHTDFSLTGAFDDQGGPTYFGGIIEGAELGPAPLPPESRRNVLRDDLDRTATDQVNFNSKLGLDTDSGSIIAVAGWRQIELRVPTYDSDGTAYEASYEDYLTDPSAETALSVPSPQAFTGDYHDTLLNAEVRFLTPDTDGPFKSQVGASYFEENARFYSQTAPLRDFALILEDAGLYGTDTQHVRQDTNAWAGFGQLIWTPRDAIEITTELRYTWEQKNFEYAKSLTGFYAIDLRPSIAQQPTATFTNWSPGVTLAYYPADTRTVYMKYVQGFHAGGFNNEVNTPALLTYEAEEAESYELGGKAQLFGQRLNVGASVFYLRIDNALLPMLDPGPGPLYAPLQNVALAETTGMELDLTVQAAAALTLTASAGVYDSKVSEEGPPAFGNRAYVSDFTGSLTAEYQWPLTTSMTGTATLGYRHRSGGRVPCFCPFKVEMDSYNLLDAQLGVIVDKVLVAGFVQNALNDHYIVANFDPVGTQREYLKQSGLDVRTTRMITRDPGIVFGVRAIVAF